MGFCASAWQSIAVPTAPPAEATNIWIAKKGLRRDFASPPDRDKSDTPRVQSYPLELALPLSDPQWLAFCGKNEAVPAFLSTK